MHLEELSQILTTLFNNSSLETPQTRATCNEAVPVLKHGLKLMLSSLSIFIVQNDCDDTCWTYGDLGTPWWVILPHKQATNGISFFKIGLTSFFNHLAISVFVINLSRRYIICKFMAEYKVNANNERTEDEK